MATSVLAGREDETTEPKATLDDLAWFAGHWRSEAAIDGSRKPPPVQCDRRRGLVYRGCQPLPGALSAMGVPVRLRRARLATLTRRSRVVATLIVAHAAALSATRGEDARGEETVTFEIAFGESAPDDVEMRGPVTVSAGRAVLGTASSVGRDVTSRGRFKLTTDVTPAELPSETRVVFAFASGDVVHVELRRDDDGTHLAVGGRHDDGTGPQERLARRVQRKEAVIGALSVTFDHGWVVVRDSHRVLTSHYLKRADYDLVRCSIEQLVGSTSISSVRFEGALPLQLSETARAEVEKAAVLGDEMWATKERGSFAEALPLAEETLDLLTRHLGPDDPLTLRIHNDVAELHFHLASYAESRDAHLAALDGRARRLGEDHPDYAESANNLAHALLRLDEPEEARRRYREAGDIRVRALGENHVLNAESLQNLAATFRTDEPEKALPLYLRSADIYRSARAESMIDYAICLSNLGHTYSRLGRYADQIEPLTTALELAEAKLGKEHPFYGLMLNNLAIAHGRSGDFERAESLYKLAIETSRKRVGDAHPMVVQAMSNLAVAYERVARYQDAARVYDEVVPVAERAFGESVKLTTHYTSIAANYTRLGRLDEADALLRRALEIRRAKLGEGHPGVAVVLRTIAMVEKERGDYARAEELLFDARRILAPLGEAHPYAISTTKACASLLRMNGDLARAEELLVVVKEACESSGATDTEDYAGVLHELAALLHGLGRYDDAAATFERACTIKLELGGETTNYISSLMSLGMAYTSLERYDDAVDVLRRAFEIRERVLGEVGFGIRTNLAIALLGAGRVDEAKRVILEAREIVNRGDWHDPDTTFALSRTVTHYYLTRQYEKAWPHTIELIESRVRTAHHHVPSMSTGQALAWLTRYSSPMFAVLSVAREIDVPDREVYELLWSGRALLTRLLTGQRVPPDATPETRALFDDLRRARAEMAQLALATPPPESRDRFTAALRQVGEEKEALERAIARADATAGRSLRTRDATLADLAAVLPAGTAVVDIFAEGAWRPTPPDVDLDQGVQTPPRADLVYDAFVVTVEERRLDVQWVPLGRADEIDAAVRDWRRALGRGGDRGMPAGVASARGPRTDEVASADRWLRDRIWSPIEAALGGRTDVVIIPGGTLHSLPWAALPGRDAGSYLIEEYSFTTASFGQQLVDALSTPPPTSGGLLAMGDVEYGKGEAPPTDARAPVTPRPARRDVRWAPLPATAREIAQIEARFRATSDESAVVLSGSEPTESAVTRGLRRARYAHFATHGFFTDPNADDDPLQSIRDARSFDADLTWGTAGSAVAGRNPYLLSGIALAGANLEAALGDDGVPIGDDGILTAEEIAGLDLGGTELAVLSACETGLGEARGEAGLFGLGRVLHAAGTRAVIGSLWKVDDHATQLLMGELYRNLWERGLPKREALRDAQLAMLRRYDAGAESLGDVATDRRTHPFYWAAFVLSGDPR